MPTGYTCDIEKGITFKEYALRCARAFGACIDMRDEPLGTSIPDEFKESDYYKKEVNKIQKELQELDSISDAKLQKKMDSEYAEQIKNNQKYIKECKALNKKYDKMLAKVEKWSPPSPEHIGLKEFMKQQIEISYSDYSYWEKQKIIKLSVEQYRYEKKKYLQKDLDQAMKNWKEETERVTGRNLWVKQLKESLQ